jgi:hypothetical protein
MSQVTELASGQLKRHSRDRDRADRSRRKPAVIIVRWPAKTSVLHPRRFPAAADVAAESSLPLP